MAMRVRARSSVKIGQMGQTEEGGTSPRNMPHEVDEWKDEREILCPVLKLIMLFEPYFPSFIFTFFPLTLSTVLHLDTTRISTPSIH
jgi:hypothetical protein